MSNIFNPSSSPYTGDFQWKDADSNSRVDLSFANPDPMFGTVTTSFMGTVVHPSGVGSDFKIGANEYGGTGNIYWDMVPWDSGGSPIANLFMNDHPIWQITKSKWSFYDYSTYAEVINFQWDATGMILSNSLKFNDGVSFQGTIGAIDAGWNGLQITAPNITLQDQAGQIDINTDILNLTAPNINIPIDSILYFGGTNSGIASFVSGVLYLFGNSYVQVGSSIFPSDIGMDLGDEYGNFFNNLFLDGYIRSGSLTSGRIPYITTNSKIVDNSSFLYDGTNLSLSSGKIVLNSEGSAWNDYTKSIQIGSTNPTYIHNESGTGPTWISFSTDGLRFNPLGTKYVAINASLSNASLTIGATFSSAGTNTYGLWNNTFTATAGAGSTISSSRSFQNTCSANGTTSGATITSLDAIYNQVGFSASSLDTITTARSEVLRIINGASATGTIGTAINCDMQIQAVAAAITTAYGLVSYAPTKSTGSIGTFYHIYLETPTIATTNWSIYSQGGNCAFGGNTRFGGTLAPVATVDVTGNIVTTTSIACGSNSYIQAAGTYSAYLRVTNISGTYNYPTIQSSGSALYIDVNNSTDTLNGGSGYVGFFNATSFGFNDNKGLIFGTNVVGKHVGIYGSNSGTGSQTDGASHRVQTLYIGLTDTDWSAPNYIACRYMLIIDGSDKAYDFQHPVQTNPTLFIHSANQSRTQWIGITHDATDGVISTGTGDLKLSSNSGYVNVTTGYKVNGTSPVADGTYNIDGSAVGTVSSITTKGGIITAITTR